MEGGEEGKNVHQIRENDRVLERAGHPDQIQRILIDTDLTGERTGIVGAQKRAAVRVDADAEVADADLELGAADDVGDGCRDARVDLGGIEDWRVGLVVERYEEYAGDQGG